MKIAILASGGLGLKCIEDIFKNYKIDFIATDSASAGIIEFAEQKAIPVFKGNPRKGKLFEFAKGFQLDILFSINYLFIIEPDMISLAVYPINFHGSLLPKYRGRTPHVWSIINNEKQTGITAHIIDDGCDTGDIILQKLIGINEVDTGNDILQKYVAIYPGMINEIIALFKKNAIQSSPQQHALATYFDKRTPEDGEINWNWQKERINNWIRAQALPYPGAFTFFNSTKIIIDKIAYSDIGYNNNIANGTVLKCNGEMMSVKTSNGAIDLIEIRKIEGGVFPPTGSKLGS